MAVAGLAAGISGVFRPAQRNIDLQAREPTLDTVRLFLCGDVMTGRGIDQIMRVPGSPELFERRLKDATEYINLAEAASGPIPRRVDPAYVWGDALPAITQFAPDARIVNLETSVTTARNRWLGKGIHYRMNPANAGCIAAAQIDCCVLANNHVLDWGSQGLRDTIFSIQSAGSQIAGAGETLSEARAPAVIDRGRGWRILVFSYGSRTSGIPGSWSASFDKPGMALIDEFDPAALRRVARDIHAVKRAGDIAVVSIHWGVNWGYEVTPMQRQFARRLVEDSGVDIFHGHSSHHPRPFEIHRGKLILYGCGDFLNDYEGIQRFRKYRHQLVFMYFPEIAVESGQLVGLSLVPMRIEKFRLNQATPDEAEWLRRLMEKKGRDFGVRLQRGQQDCLEVVGLS